MLVVIHGHQSMIKSEVSVGTMISPGLKKQSQPCIVASFMEAGSIEGNGSHRALPGAGAREPIWTAPPIAGLLPRALWNLKVLLLSLVPGVVVFGIGLHCQPTP